MVGIGRAGRNGWWESVELIGKVWWESIELVETNRQTCCQRMANLLNKSIYSANRCWACRPLLCSETPNMGELWVDGYIGSGGRTSIVLHNWPYLSRYCLLLITPRTSFGKGCVVIDLLQENRPILIGHWHLACCQWCQLLIKLSKPKGFTTQEGNCTRWVSVYTVTF